MDERDRPDPRRPQLLSRLAVELSQVDYSRPQGWRLCQAMSRVLGADGAALAIAYESRDRTILGASDDVVATLLDLEEVMGQGPGWESLARAAPVSCVVADEGDAPWPAFVAAALERVGSLRVTAMPVAPMESVTGVALLYTRDQELGAPPELATFLGEVVALALAGDQAYNPVPPQEPWQFRATIHQATGMVMSQLHVTAEDALALLRAHAFATSTSLDIVARTVTDQTVDLLDYWMEGD